MSDIQSLIKDGTLTDPKSARGRLLAQAAHLFKQKGFERTTVRDIASAVGIQSGSIFHHFKSKEQILCAVMQETVLYNTAKMRTTVKQVSSPKEKVLALIRCELESIIGLTGEAMAVLVYEWRSLTEKSQQTILELRDIYEQIWMDAIEEAQASGLVVGDPFVLRRFLTGALSWTTSWFNPDGEMTLDELAEQALYLAIKE